jgi:hypothetical protein
MGQGIFSLIVSVQVCTTFWHICIIRAISNLPKCMRVLRMHPTHFNFFDEIQSKLPGNKRCFFLAYVCYEVNDPSVQWPWCSSCSWSVLLVSLSYQVLFGFRSRVILRLRWTVPSLCFASHSNGQWLKMCLCVSRYTMIMAIWSCNRWAVWCRCSCPEELVRACDFVGYWAHLQAAGLYVLLLDILCLCSVVTLKRSLSRIPDSYDHLFSLLCSYAFTES